MKRQQITLTNEKYIELMNILVNARKISKLTQKQMAQRLGGSNKWLSDIENLKQVIDIGSFVKYCKVLLYSPSKLIEILENEL